MRVVVALTLVAVSASPALAQTKWPRGKPEVYWSGRKKLQNDDYDGAIKDFTKSIPLVHEKAQFWRGTAYQEKGDLPKAAADFTAVIESGRGPRWPAHEARAKVRHALGDYDGAIKDLSVLIQRRASRPLYHQRGSAKAAKRDYRAAIADFTEALKPNAQFVYRSTAQRERGRARACLGDLPGAITDYTALVADTPRGGTSGYLSRGVTRALMGDRAGAAEDLKRASTLLKGNLQADLWRAHILGKPAPADTKASRLNSTRTHVAVGRYWRGGLSEQQLLAQQLLARSKSGASLVRCVSHCFIGLRAEAAGDRVKATKSYRTCVATGVAGALEYQWAVVRLRQWSKPAASPRCGKCRKAIPTGSTFCNHCGAKVPPPTRVCAKCSKVLPKSSNFCNGCGAKQ